MIVNKLFYYNFRLGLFIAILVVNIISLTLFVKPGFSLYYQSILLTIFSPLFLIIFAPLLVLVIAVIGFYYITNEPYVYPYRVKNSILLSILIVSIIINLFATDIASKRREAQTIRAFAVAESSFLLDEMVSSIKDDAQHDSMYLETQVGESEIVSCVVPKLIEDLKISRESVINVYDHAKHYTCDNNPNLKIYTNEDMTKILESSKDYYDNLHKVWTEAVDRCGKGSNQEQRDYIFSIMKPTFKTSLSDAGAFLPEEIPEGEDAFSAPEQIYRAYVRAINKYNSEDAGFRSYDRYYDPSFSRSTYVKNNCK